MLKSKKIILSFLFALAICLIIPFQALAAEEVAKDPAKGVIVYPSIIELSAKKGQDLSSSFTYLNNTDSDQIINLDLAPYILSEKTSGSPIFNDESGRAITSEASSWINLEKVNNQVVKAGQEKIITFSISVPDTAETKEYYNAIFVTSNPDIKVGETSGNVINYRMGVLTVIDVAENRAIDINKYFKMLQGSYLNYYFMLVAALIIIFIALLLIVKKRNSTAVKKSSKKVSSKK